MTQQIKLYPQPPEFLFDQMVDILRELDWKIEQIDRPSLFIFAKKLTKGEAFSALISGEQKFHEAAINFVKRT